jgi:hypothetical protein
MSVFNKIFSRISSIALLTLAIALTGCTFANISSIPLEIEGVGTVYRYQGRANYSHQFAEADKLIAEDCKARNGGKPVIVNLQKRDIGTITFEDGQARTRINATSTRNQYNSNIIGNATTRYSGSTTEMRNYNQEILYKCVAE